ncbi:hypothetical protein [Nonomuraea sp. 10N515B]|uniref:hypothetical protein n=1 Tax=Nonomuraea sp. 10N515B TaxID=3457422 RepID=UPI003FCED114
MSLWVCSDCSTRYAPGLEACPHCRGAERVEEGSPQGSRLPVLDVACPRKGCRAEGTVRRVHLRVAALGVVEMPHLLLCACCGAAMPALRSWIDEETDMPKITRHGGPTNAAAEREHQAAAPSEGIEVPADGTLSPEITGDGTGEALPPADDSTGKEESSPGNSSSTSAEKPPMSGEPRKPARPKRARTTASRSKAGQTASSTAGGTAGPGPETPDEGKDG